MNSQACGSNALQRKIMFSQKRIDYNHYISHQENLKGIYYEETNECSVPMRLFKPGNPILRKSPF